MKSVVINAGSSSVKFQIFNDNNESLLQGLCEEIGSERSNVKYSFDGKKHQEKVSLPEMKDAFTNIISILKKHDLFEGLELAVHRVVHGGEEFKDATLVTPEIIAKLKELIPLAPLHNPANIAGLEILMELLPDAKQIAIFDTAYHSTLPEKAYLYGVPYSWYTNHKIRRYGFHGSSHQYVIAEAQKKLDKSDSKIISCHLGNGSSICAALGGKSINTSMGFTPLEGLVMGTRSGTIDPAIITHMMKIKDLSHDDINTILNKESGLLGLSEKTSDMRILEETMDDDEGAKRAIEIFCHRIIQIIGSYTAELNGLDAIVFTGGIGENGFIMRDIICNQLTFLGLEFDSEKNKSTWKKGDQQEGTITTDASKIKVFVIPTNEELQMVKVAKDTLI